MKVSWYIEIQRQPVALVDPHVTRERAWAISKVAVTITSLLAAIGFALTRYAIKKGRSLDEHR